MRFLVDVCVDVRVAVWLREQGYDAIHLRELGLQRLPNGSIFSKAATENRIVLTFDLDFSEIIALSHGQKADVIVLRLRDTRHRHVIERLSRVLPGLEEKFGQGAIVMLEEHRYRIKYFPTA